MSKDETPPWPMGSTYYNGGTIDSSNLGGTQFEGKEYRFEDVWFATNQYITVRAVRNNGTFALLPSRLCQFDPAYYGDRINGYATVSYGPGVLLDSQLPAAGLLPNDIGYVIMEGPTTYLTPLDGAADNVVLFLDPLAAITAATSGATTAGRLATANTSGSTTSQRDSLLNVVGRALSAATTANTNALKLVGVTRIY